MTGIQGIKVTADEARELEQKSHDTWHWREVDLREWARLRIATLFKKRVLIDTETQHIELWKTEMYGEAFATSRKGVTEVTCNLDCRIYWRGQLHFNGGIVGSAEGTIKFPEVVAAVAPEDWKMKILADGEDPSAMKLLNPCGSLEETQLRPLESYEVKLRDATATCAEEIRGLMAKFVLDMQAHAAGEVVSEVCDDKAEGEEEAVSDKVREEVEAKMEQIRVEGIPAKFEEVVGQIQANDEALEKAELSVCRISDTEMTRIIAALKDNTNLKRLNVSFNQITDVGVQALVTALATGAAKGLVEISITNNQIGEMGQRMLSGVGFMRKGLTIKSASSIDNIGPKAS